MKKHVKFIFIYFITFVVMGEVSAKEMDVKSILYTGNSTLNIDSRLSINKKILVMLEQVKKEPKVENQKLLKLTLETASFNSAENYLILKAQAIQALARNDNKLSISILMKAKLLLVNIPKLQQNDPMFSGLHLILSKNYVVLDKFDLAYIEKKEYLEKYRDYSEMKRKKTITLLNDKYKVSHKTTTNLLLDNKNSIKLLQLAEVERDSKIQKNNFIILASTLFLLVLVFLYQLKLRKELTVFTKTDALTGISNRTYLFNMGEDLIKDFSNKEDQLSLLLLDIDHFKKINDEFGHLVGDSVLIKIASLVGETMRHRDVFARLGGEEFVAILPRADIDIAKVTAARIKEKITQYYFNDLGINRAVTVSIGVANLAQVSKESDTLQQKRKQFDHLLHAADVAMYQAKTNGRNCIVAYSNVPM